MFDNLLNLIFPNVCGFCDEITKNNLCDSCKVKSQIHKKEKELYVFDKYFDELLYLYNYEGIIRDSIIKYKFNDKSYIYKTFAEEIINSQKLSSKIKKIDMIIPVPISKKRKEERGYNQSQLIAKYLSKKFNKKYIKNVLIKNKNNLLQSSLNKTKREKNVIGVYDIPKEKNFEIENKNVILIDDIYTTGSTVNECSKILKNKGHAKSVVVLVIAKD